MIRRLKKRIDKYFYDRNIFLNRKNIVRLVVALEEISGKDVSIKEFNFKNINMQICIGGKSEEILFDFPREECGYIKFFFIDRWYLALFEKKQNMIVLEVNSPEATSLLSKRVSF